MRANGTRTPAELTRALAVIDLRISHLRIVDAQFSKMAVALEAVHMPVGDEVGEAWNATHDAITALQAERREVEANRPTVLTGTALLIAENRD